ncbi:phytoene desaturase [candidate division KSB1 bacterium]|nr:phytoene desaturase [candidate division KSB1 bacterium]
MSGLNNIIIVGGGLGGLSSAIHLARHGLSVTLLEQNETLGGKMNEHRMNGYRFDTGPSLMTMPFVLDDLLTAAGSDRGIDLPLIPLEPMCRYFFPDGVVFDASSQMEEMIAAVTRLSPVDATGFQRFMDYSRRIYDLTAPVFLFTPIHEWRRILRWRHLRTLFSLPAIDPFRTVHQGVARFFHDQRMVQLFDRYATYNGSNPSQAPATLNIIPYVEYGFGGFYITGGMYRMVDALTGLAKRLGVTIETGVKVEKILHDGGKITGVRADGENRPATHVVCNADVVTAHTDLLDVEKSLERRMTKLEPSLSGVIFLWGIKNTYPELRHHNIFFCSDYTGEFKEIFIDKQVPSDPTVYIAITSRADASDAPPGCENWFVLVNAPYLAPNQDWPTAVQMLRTSVFRILLQHGFDVASRVACERVLTPLDFQTLYGSNRGSIYGISSNSRSTAFRRPGNRSRNIRGLYFAGGSSHPGGGVPLVLLSGKMAAELLLDSLVHH